MANSITPSQLRDRNTSWWRRESGQPFLSVLTYIIVAIAYSVFLLPSDELIWALLDEDGPYENAGALCLLMAALLSFLSYLSIHRREFDSEVNTNDWLKRNNVFYFCLALLFFFGFGEEISWGQRIVSWPTPEFMRDLNIQGETTLHNLDFMVIDQRHRIFGAFWILTCVMIPFLNYAFPSIRNYFKSARVPVTYLWIGGAFVMTELAFRGSRWFTDPTSLFFAGNERREVKEFLQEFLFMTMMFLEFRKIRSGMAPSD